MEQLISDERISLHRRVAYALEFLTGLRPGEVSALRWGDYEPEVTPLGKLTAAVAYNSKKKVVKKTKTGAVHEVPVHPTLAKMLGLMEADRLAEADGEGAEAGRHRCPDHQRNAS